MNRETLMEKTAKDLRKQAEDAGHTVSANANESDIISLILGEVIKQENKPLPPEKGGLYSMDGKLIKGRQMKVTVMSTETAKHDVKLAINGHQIVIKRDVEVILDEAWVEVLKNARSVNKFTDADGKVTTTATANYPFSAVPA